METNDLSKLNAQVTALKQVAAMALAVASTCHDRLNGSQSGGLDDIRDTLIGVMQSTLERTAKRLEVPADAMSRVAAFNLEYEAAVDEILGMTDGIINSIYGQN